MEEQYIHNIVFQRPINPVCNVSAFKWQSCIPRSVQGLQCLKKYIYRVLSIFL